MVVLDKGVLAATVIPLVTDEYIFMSQEFLEHAFDWSLLIMFTGCTWQLYSDTLGPVVTRHTNNNVQHYTSGLHSLWRSKIETKRHGSNQSDIILEVSGD